MDTRRKYILIAAIIILAGFAYLKNSHRNMPSDLRDAVGNEASADDGFNDLLGANASDIQPASKVTVPVAPVPKVVPDAILSDEKKEEYIYVGDKVLVVLAYGQREIGKVKKFFSNGTVEVNCGIMHHEIVSLKQVYKPVKSIGDLSADDQVLVLLPYGQREIGRVKMLFANGEVEVDYNHDKGDNPIQSLKYVYKSVKSTGTFSVGDLVIDAHNSTGMVKMLFTNGSALVGYGHKYNDAYQEIGTLSKQKE